MEYLHVKRAKDQAHLLQRSRHKQNRFWPIDISWKKYDNARDKIFGTDNINCE